MLSVILTEIEEKISRLPRKKQRWLIDQLERKFKEDSNKSAVDEQAHFASQLPLMANDPEVQAELKKIEQEFAITEGDGLEGDNGNSSRGNLLHQSQPCERKRASRP